MSLGSDSASDDFNPSSLAAARLHPPGLAGAADEAENSYLDVVTKAPTVGGGMDSADLDVAGMDSSVLGDAGAAAETDRFSQSALGMSVIEVSADGVVVTGHPPKRKKPVPGGVLELTDADAASIVAYARGVVEAVIRRVPLPHFSSRLAAVPTCGVFVTIDRIASLRACRGRFGAGQPLGQALTGAAQDAATIDPRFPTLLADELPYLQIDVSLMFALETMTAAGTDRAQAIEVGRHGLVLTHPKGRGLLLPQVAAGAGWDSRQFLNQLAEKAGLPPGAWLDADAQVATFEARVLTSPPHALEFDPRRLTRLAVDRLLLAAEAALHGQSQDPEFAAELLTPHPHQLGVYLQTTHGRNATTVATQNSLLELTFSACRALKQGAESEGSKDEHIARLVILWQPISLLARDYPDRHRSLRGMGIVSQGIGRWGLSIPAPKNLADPIATALRTIERDPESWKSAVDLRLTAFTLREFAPAVQQTPESVRTPARAGQFYPSTPDGISQAVEQYLGLPGQTQTYRAVLLPHAGWAYCGEIIGETLAGVRIPKTVIVLSPKHTPFGAWWSVSPADRWDFPGFSVSVAGALRARLRQMVPQLESEPEAHRQEHGVEVLVPFLHRLNPEVEILPIVLGQTELASTAVLAHALAALCRELPEPPLLVISSDLNHFAPEPENRRLDHLAIAAVQTGDPRQLWDTVTSNRISMCGLVPAVTVLAALAESSLRPEPELVEYSNSGLVSGNYSRVVGYAGLRVR